MVLARAGREQYPPSVLAFGEENVKEPLRGLLEGRLGGCADDRRGFAFP
jgi:hypothetical protein